MRRGDRRRPAGSGARPADDRPRADPAAGDPPGHPHARRAGERADALLERVGLADAADRRVGDVLRRHAAPARPRRRARPRAPRPLPRRADHRPRPGQPQDDLGGGAGAERRRHHRLPHHAVPRGGRPARRQRRDHRQRPDRRRGHARGAQGRDRQSPHPPAARGGLGRRGRAAPAARFGKLLPAGGRQDGPGRGPRAARADIPRVVRALDEAGIGVDSLELVHPTLDDVFVEQPPAITSEEDERGLRAGGRSRLERTARSSTCAWCRGPGQALGRFRPSAARS